MWLPILGIATLEFVANIMAKWGYPVVAVAGYALVGLWLASLYRASPLATVAVVQTTWSLLAPLLALVGGVLVFQENVQRLYVPVALSVLGQVILGTT